MCIFVDHFRFLNFDLGGWGVQIRNQRPHKLPSTEFHPNQITFVILIRHIGSGGPSDASEVLLAPPHPTIYKIYNKVAERLPKTEKTFTQTCNSLINKI